MQQQYGVALLGFDIIIGVQYGVREALGLNSEAVLKFVVKSVKH